MAGLEGPLDISLSALAKSRSPCELSCIVRRFDFDEEKSEEKKLLFFLGVEAVAAAASPASEEEEERSSDEEVLPAKLPEVVLALLPPAWAFDEEDVVTFADEERAEDEVVRGPKR